ncbi:MAG TPA: hypothetical protein VGE37_11950 [Archangium sp.]
MSYACPQCSGPVQRASGNAGAFGGGIAGVLLASAFAGFQCAKCGTIERSKFPPEVRSKMMMMSALMVGGAIALIVAVVGVLVALN